MEKLTELVRRYQSVKTLEELLGIAEEIVKAASPRLEGYLLRECRERELAQDLLQKTLLSITQGLK
jgi:DNA-directed RNA polymerase specialized sigma24 family protein